MIEIFERLTDNDKAKFIEMSYKEMPAYSGFDAYPKEGVLVGDRIASDTQYASYFELSPVFITMALVAQQRVNDMRVTYEELLDSKKNDSYNRMIFTSQVMIGITLFGQTLFYNPYTEHPVNGFHVQIDKKPDDSGTMEWDRIIKIEGYTTMADTANLPAKWQKELSFTVNQFRDDVDGLMKDNASSITRAMIPEVAIADDIFRACMGLIPYKHIGNVATVIFAAVGIGEAVEAEKAARAKANLHDNVLNYGSLSEVFCFGAALTVMPDGTYLSSCITIEKISWRYA
jgi:hypothetical protein